MPTASLTLKHQTVSKRWLFRSVAESHPVPGPKWVFDDCFAGTESYDGREQSTPRDVVVGESGDFDPSRVEFVTPR
jgi:hypothetical protein